MFFDVLRILVEPRVDKQFAVTRVSAPARQHEPWGDRPSLAPGSWITPVSFSVGDEGDFPGSDKSWYADYDLDPLSPWPLVWWQEW